MIVQSIFIQKAYIFCSCIWMHIHVLRLSQTIKLRTCTVDSPGEDVHGAPRAGFRSSLAAGACVFDSLVKWVWLKLCPSVWATLHPQLARDVTWHTADRIKRERERERNCSEKKNTETNQVRTENFGNFTQIYGVKNSADTNAGDNETHGKAGWHMCVQIHI